MALDAVVVMRSDGTVADWNEQAEVIFGWYKEEAVGRFLSDLIIPPQYRKAHVQGLQRYLATGEGPVVNKRIEVTALHKRGREFPVELSIAPVDGAGEVLFLGFLRDITERKRSEQELADREAYLTALIEQTTAGVAQVDERGYFILVNERFCQMLGCTREELLAQRMQDVTHPDDLPGNLSLFERVVAAGESFQIEKRYVRPDGSIIWVSNSVNRVQLGAGEPVAALAVSVDITERKRADQLQQLLINELHHRVKNSLAIVQSIAYQSFKGTNIPSTAKEAFDGRLAALAAANDLLTRENWESTSIQQVIEKAVSPFRTRSDCFVIEGPDLRLQSKTAISLALTLHELGTNAVKYGALSNAAGRVELQWRLEEDRMKLVWRESGGPTVVPPSRRGFGSRLIERSLASELSGRVTIDFRPEGVVCTIDAQFPS